MKAIEVNNLRKEYQDVLAVDGICFHVEKGELFGFLGVNGAGKSTTIHMLCTLFPPTDGEAYIFGKKLGEDDMAIRKDIGVVYQKDCLDEILSVRDNLLIRGSLYQSDRKALYRQLEHVSAILGLSEILHRPFGKLSGGQKRRCEIARALMHAPRILFLDEPTTGLDPATRKMVWECIDILRKEEAMTVFLTTHYMEEAARANRIAIIDHGVMKETGTPFALKSRYAKDKMILYPNDVGQIQNYLERHGYAYQLIEGIFQVELAHSLTAIAIAKEVEPWLQGLEIIQGTMDDVFLNVTGRCMEETR